ncbi:ABC transporter I family member 20 [Triticum urartu]|uniref:ABC transporter I family member 20 n=1 Tax=Triticum urartu TaxID=4572 RepID=M7YJJ3_TRIUA|nr:ABC transporter I family member 20 [Triticum urartu]
MAPTVEIRNLTFTYPGIDGKPPPGAPPLIEDVCFSLEAGQRCLLVGSNGAGKTTILKILGGKHMVDPSMVRVLGRSAFHDTALTSSGDLCYLGGEWRRDVAFAGYQSNTKGTPQTSPICPGEQSGHRSTLPKGLPEPAPYVRTARTSPDQAHIWGGNGAVRTCPPCPAYPRRICPNNLGINWGWGTPLEGKTKSGRFCGQMGCQILGLPLEMLLHLNYILDVDLTWRMHKASDGQRRRVQICMGLLKPFKVLLLDEITVDLDVLARANLLTYLKKECAEQGATIIYATHIFDGLDDWPTHIVYVAHGKLQLALPLEKVKEMSQLSLMRTVERWLRKERDEDRRKRKERKEKGLPAFDKVIEGSRVVNNGWAAGRLTSTIAGEENFSLSSNSVLR